MKRQIIIAVLLSATLVTPAVADAKIPIGASDFCNANPSECAASGSASVPYSDDLKALLRSVNDEVNHRIVAVKEIDEQWTLNPTHGDCEDFALTKRRELIDRGIPSAAMSIAVVEQWPFESGRLHAVLIVRTDSGDYVLDNVDPYVLTMENTNLKYMKASTPDGLESWEDLHGWITPLLETDPAL